MIMRLYDAANNHVYYEHINLCATISNYLFPTRTVHPRLLQLRRTDEEPGAGRGSGPAVLPGQVWSVLQSVTSPVLPRHPQHDPLLMFHTVLTILASHVLNNPILCEMLLWCSLTQTSCAATLVPRILWIKEFRIKILFLFPFEIIFSYTSVTL